MSESNSGSGDETQPSSWIYEGLWGLLTSVFCVPRQAPTLPAVHADQIVSRKPSPGYLKYLKFQFWIPTIILAVVLIGGSLIAAAVESPWFLVLSAVIVVALILLIGFAYLAIQLRYDTTWYVFSDRSMRLRRGLWLIRESTITFENIQNVKVTQGPLQRWFGIANLVVETAGGGGGQSEPGAGLGMHSGLIEGVAEAKEIRDSIMSRVRLTSTTGLGDEASRLSPTILSTAQHLEVLREIRDLARRAAGE